MFAVGALDAYFCDAYTDIVAATIIAKSQQPRSSLPEFFYDIKLPGPGHPRAVRITSTGGGGWPRGR